MTRAFTTDTTTSKITTEGNVLPACPFHCAHIRTIIFIEFDAFFVDLATQEGQDDRPTQRVDGDLTVNVNRENVYFYLDYIQGLASANAAASGSGHFRGPEIPRNLGRRGTFRLVLENNRRNVTLFIQNDSGAVLHTYRGTGNVDAGLVGTWTGRWS